MTRRYVWMPSITDRGCRAQAQWGVWRGKMASLCARMTVLGLAAVLLCFGGYMSRLGYHKPSRLEMQVSHMTCPQDEFSLPGMQSCHPLLTCADIESADLSIYERIGHGAIKIVRRGQWKGYSVAINTLTEPLYKHDFQLGLNLLRRMQPSDHVTQFVGHCGNTSITQYHTLGAAGNINTILKRSEMRTYDTLSTRFSLCISYVQAIVFLHNSPLGTCVMCDSSSLRKTLSQFLLTYDLKLVLNDLDALSFVNRSRGLKVKCGHGEPKGDVVFVAPEQLWLYPERPFVEEDMQLYDEKPDIWKIPDICNYFIGDGPGSEPLKSRLFNIHMLCKRINPEWRPSAKEVLQEYHVVFNELLVA